MTHGNQVLSEQIERLVREHIEGSRRAAAAAVERAFLSASARPRSKAASTPTRTKGSGRREPAEVAALGEQFYEAVCAQPGETMAVLAREVGGTPRQMHRPMTLLKRAGRVRSVGQRHQTRYFPAVVRSAASVG